VPVVEAALTRARKGAELGTFWALDEQGALGQAAELDRRPSSHEQPLAGTTVAVKDLFDLAGVPTTAGLERRLA
jgi:Asp-tRNA(Asn)/Glu-tRNA(Gln) amidotransferase A subunit family amidase